MVSTRGVALRQEHAQRRVDAASGRIAKRLGIEMPESPARRRDAVAEAIERLETLADFVEAVDGALKDEGFAATAKAKAEASDEPAPAPAATTVRATAKPKGRAR